VIVMPLIVICGVPLCGKTLRANEIASNLRSTPEFARHWPGGIHLINDANSGVSYADYGDFNKEKEARGRIRSQAEKYVENDSVTIIDSPNYIKGFRYELWCVARAASTTCCCVVPVGNYDDCRARNKARIGEGIESYTEQQLEELILRWEEPDKNRRWESPLIPLLDEEKTDVQLIIDAIAGKAPPPHRATTNPPLKATDFLQETDEKVKRIIRQIQAAQKSNGSADGGIEIKTEDGDIVALTKFMSPAQLSRVRQQFKTYLRNMPSAKSPHEAVKLFLQFLTDDAK